MNARRFNERFDAAVRDPRLDLESVLRLLALEDALRERAAAPVPAPEREAPAEVAA